MVAVHQLGLEYADCTVCGLLRTVSWRGNVQTYFSNCNKLQQAGGTTSPEFFEAEMISKLCLFDLELSVR